MAQTVATPANLDEFAQELGTSLAETLGGGGGSGDSNYVQILAYLSNREDGETQRLYLGIDPSLDLTGITLQFGRSNKVYDRDVERKENQLPPLYHKGWHQVWAIPQSDKIPLFNELHLKSKWIDYNGRALYEVTSGDYDSFIDFLTDDEDNTTGYQSKDSEGDMFDVTRDRIVANARCGICLVRDGEIISNYATFGGVYDQDDEFHLRK